MLETETNHCINTEKIVFSVYDISQLLGIGINQAYTLVKSGVFPAKRVGNKFVILKEAVFKWLSSDDKKVS